MGVDKGPLCAGNFERNLRRVVDVSEESQNTITCSVSCADRFFLIVLSVQAFIINKSLILLYL